MRIAHRFFSPAPRAGAALLGLALGAAVCAASPAPARADAIGEAMHSVAAMYGPDIVTLTAVNSITERGSGQSRQQDFTMQFKGVVVSPDGLVMCSSAYLTDDRLPQIVPSSLEATLTPKSIQVTLGDEATSYFGTLAASDPVLGLAFVQLRDLKGRKLTYIDLPGAAQAVAGGAPPQQGDPTVAVTRLGKSNDYALFGVEDRITAVIDKPRQAFMPEGLATNPGLPVFNLEGVPFGVVTFAQQGALTPEDQQSEVFAARFGDDLNTRRPQYIVPMSSVAPLVKLATARAAALPPFVAPTPDSLKPAPPVGATTAPPATTKSAPAKTTPPAAPPAASGGIIRADPGTGS